MFAAVWGVTVAGLRAHLIRVEVDVSNGLPSLDLVGLPATAVREAGNRVRSALRNSGFTFPLQRVTVNLAPADQRKDGSSLDLPIALGILAATGQIRGEFCQDHVFVGELSLEGNLREVPGVLSMALDLTAHGSPLTLIVPPANLREARLVKGIKSISALTLAELIGVLAGNDSFNQTWPEPDNEEIEPEREPAVDFKDIRGQYHAKRALEIGAAGGHNLILIGPPGSGKTMLARAYADILPPLSEEESLEVTQLYSLAGLLGKQARLITERPFRHPHHSATPVGILGGGRDLRPGELSLANHGVLFLDELPEFPRVILESLRQPLEDRKLTITRQKGSVDMPASLSLIASMNPCQCGFFSDQSGTCRCTPHQIKAYRGRVSGPLLDRFDLHVEVPRLSFGEMHQEGKTENSTQVRERVSAARKRQWERLGNRRTNAEMSGKETKAYCSLTSEGEALLKRVFEHKQLSGRAYDRILRVSRTIADLAGSEIILPVHLAQATRYRVLDREDV